jgi:hypothetical protein
MHIRFSRKCQKERKHWNDTNVGGSNKMDPREHGIVWTGMIWLRIGTSTLLF